MALPEVSTLWGRRPGAVTWGAQERDALSGHRATEGQRQGELPQREEGGPGRSFNRKVRRRR